MTPSDGGGTRDLLRETPVGDRLQRAKEEAVAMTEVRKDVQHLGEKVDGLSDAVKALAAQDHRCAKEGDLKMHEGRLDAQDVRVDGVEKRLDWGKGAWVTIGLFIVGTLGTVLVTCSSQAERDAETRVMVQTNSVNISKLEKSIVKVNAGRDEDVKSIVHAIENLQQTTKQQSADQWWDDLPSRHKSAIIRTVGKHAVPTTDD
jgi:hypothetical protein